MPECFPTFIISCLYHVWLLIFRTDTLTWIMWAIKLIFSPRSCELINWYFEWWMALNKLEWVSHSSWLPKSLNDTRIHHFIVTSHLEHMWAFIWVLTYNVSIYTVRTTSRWWVAFYKRVCFTHSSWLYTSLNGTHIHRVFVNLTWDMWVSKLLNWYFEWWVAFYKLVWYSHSSWLWKSLNVCPHSSYHCLISRLL